MRTTSRRGIGQPLRCLVHPNTCKLYLNCIQASRLDWWCAPMLANQIAAWLWYHPNKRSSCRGRDIPPLNMDNTLYYYNNKIKYYTGKATLRRVQRLDSRLSSELRASCPYWHPLGRCRARRSDGNVVGVHAIVNENYTSIELCCYTLPPKRIKIYTGPVRNLTNVSAQETLCEIALIAGERIWCVFTGGGNYFSGWAQLTLYSLTAFLQILRLISQLTVLCMMVLSVWAFYP